MVSSKVGDQSTCHGIHQHVVLSDLGIVSGSIFRNLIPKKKPMTHAIAFRDNREMVIRSRFGCLRCKLHDSLNPYSGEVGYFACYFPRPGRHVRSLLGLRTRLQNSL
jgi:hypothetical protein